MELYAICKSISWSSLEYFQWILFIVWNLLDKDIVHKKESIHFSTWRQGQNQHEPSTQHTVYLPIHKNEYCSMTMLENPYKPYDYNFWILILGKHPCYTGTIFIRSRQIIIQFLNKYMCLTAGGKCMSTFIVNHPASGIFCITERAVEASKPQCSSRPVHCAWFLRRVSPCEQTAFGSMQPLL
jgi:hypothetical protein